MSMVWQDTEETVKLQAVIDRSKVQLELATNDGDENAAHWHAEMICQAKRVLEQEMAIQAELRTWTLRSKHSKRMPDVGGPLFGEGSLF